MAFVFYIFFGGFVSVEAVKVLGAVILGLPVIAIRTICRFVGSLIFNIVNIFVGIKNLFVLTMQEGKWWRWPLLIVKLPVVLTIQVIKLVLTATLGTLFNFFESILMTFSLLIIIFDALGKQEKSLNGRLYDLYHKNFLDYKREPEMLESSISKVLLSLTFGVVDTKEPYEGDILSVYKSFLSVIGKFLYLGQDLNSSQDERHPGMSNFNYEMRSTEIESETCFFKRSYKKEDDPAIAAAIIIAPFEVL